MAKLFIWFIIIYITSVQKKCVGLPEVIRIGKL